MVSRHVHARVKRYTAGCITNSRLWAYVSPPSRAHLNPWSASIWGKFDHSLIALSPLHALVVKSGRHVIDSVAIIYRASRGNLSIFGRFEKSLRDYTEKRDCRRTKSCGNLKFRTAKKNRHFQLADPANSLAHSTFFS